MFGWKGLPSLTKGEPETIPMMSVASTMVFRGTVRAILTCIFLVINKGGSFSHPILIVYSILFSMWCKCSLLNIPPELAFYIFSMLSPQDWLNLRQTSRSLGLLVDHPHLWRSIILNTTPSSPWKRVQIQRLIGRHRHGIEHIRIQNVSDASIRCILTDCTNLKSLHVTGWKTLTDHALKGNTPLPRLKKLTLVCTNLAALDAASITHFLERAPLLNELSICCPTAVRSQSLAASLTSTHLIKLKMYSSKRWPLEHRAVIAKKCARLSQLGIMYYQEDAMISV
jgi:F-box-like